MGYDGLRQKNVPGSFQILGDVHIQIEYPHTAMKSVASSRTITKLL